MFAPRSLRRSTSAPGMHCKGVPSSEIVGVDERRKSRFSKPGPGLTFTRFAAQVSCLALGTGSVRCYAAVHAPCRSRQYSCIASLLRLHA